MKKLLLSSALMLAMTTTANAGTFVVKGNITSITPNYVTVSISNPKQECKDIDIPIYSQQQSNSGDPIMGNILGAIVGGVVGNQFGGGNGNKAATAAGAAIGAITGGNIAKNQNSNNQRNIVGYRRESRCEMINYITNEQKIKDYLVKYEYNGHYGSVYTYNQFSVGDQITLQMELRAK
tara:strand:- start:509 stop:1045 length:537 start_codon:yes stop_codon:yes gene_type:complete